MIQLTLVQCGWEVTEQKIPLPGGEAVQKNLVFVDQHSGVTVVVPLDEPVARQMAAKLEGRPTVDVAMSMPPELNGKGNVSSMRPRR